MVIFVSKEPKNHIKGVSIWTDDFRMKKVKAKRRKLVLTASYLHGDAKDRLDQLVNSKRKFRLILTSPPYNMDREYEKNSTIEDYLNEANQIIEKLVKVLSKNGSICWQVGNYVDKSTKEVYPLDYFYYNLFKKHKLILRNRIIWHFEHGLHASQRFSGRYETILWFTKSSNYLFNLDDVRIRAKYPGKKYYKGKKIGQFSGNPKGKNPSDVWEIVKSDWEREIWDIPNVKANHREKTKHPCQYPIELVERVILATTKKGDWILDPFAGVGSTMLGALKRERNAIGIEKYKKYIKIGKERISLLRKDRLKVREIGTPIFQPNEKLAVAKRPMHFT